MFVQVTDTASGKIESSICDVYYVPELLEDPLQFSEQSKGYSMDTPVIVRTHANSSDPLEEEFKVVNAIVSLSPETIWQIS